MAQQQFPDGSMHDFPDDATADEIRGAINQWEAQKPAAQPAAGQPPAAPDTSDLAAMTPAQRSGGFTGAVARNIPVLGALPDIGAAAVKATADWLGGKTAGIDYAIDAPEAPATPPVEPSWGQRYQQNLAQMRGDEATWQTQHPYLSPLADVLGAVTVAPTAGYTAMVPAGYGAAGNVIGPTGELIAPYTARAAAKLAPAAEPAARSIGGQIATGMGLGGAAGAASGAVNALEDPNVGPSWSGGWRAGRDILTSAGWGTAAGAAAPIVGAMLSRPVSALARGISGVMPEWTGGFFGSAPDIQAARVVGRRMGEDVAAGGPGAQTITERLEATPGVVTPDLLPTPSYQFTGGKPMTIADVAGGNVQALAGRVARAPGASQEISRSFLNDRDAGAPDRLIDDVNKLIGTGADSAAVEQGLVDARQQAAQPAYQKALYDSSGAPRQITDPAVADYIAGSQPLRNAMDAIKNANPEFTNVPYTDMRLIDQAYKAIGTRTFGATDPVQQYNLEQIRRGFGGVLTQANPDYQAALDAFSGPSTSLRAIQEGRTVLNNTPAQNQQLLDQYSNPDQRLFRLGAADALRQSVSGTSLGGNEALRIVGNRNIGERIRPLFSSDDEFNQFMDRARAENQMFQTRQAALGGSPTQARLAEAAAPAGGEGAPGQLLSGLGAMAGGEIAFGATQAARGIGGLIRSAGADITAPSVNAAIARNLYSADPLTQQRFLAQVLALPPAAGQLMAPAVGGLAQAMVPPTAGFISRYGPLVSAFGPGQRESAYPRQ